MTDFSICDVVVPVTPDGLQNIDDLPSHLRLPATLNPLTVEGLLARMDKYGIGQSIIPARRYGSQWGVPYEALRDYVAQAPDRLYAIAGIDPLTKMEGVRRFEEAVRDFGFRGAHTYTSWSETDVDDRLYYPFYAKAEELGVPFMIEVMHGKAKFSNAHPRNVERVAADFPDLKIVAIHCGYPWERELVANAEFRQNFYIGYDGYPPRMWAPELIDFVKGKTFAGEHPIAKDGTRPVTTPLRCVFGSNYLSVDLDTAFDEIRAYGFSDEEWRNLMGDNARRLFGLPSYTLAGDAG